MTLRIDRGWAVTGIGVRPFELAPRQDGVFERTASDRLEHRVVVRQRDGVARRERPQWYPVACLFGPDAEDQARDLYREAGRRHRAIDDASIVETVVRITKRRGLA